jgi:hypothetical protein
MCWFQLSGDHSQKRRFSGTVCADHSIAITRRKLEVYIRKQGFFPELNRQILDTYHLFSCLSLLRAAKVAVFRVVANFRS